MAYLRLVDNNLHEIMINMDQINMVRVDQGTYFVHYFSTVENAGIAKITDPGEQTKILNNILGLTYFVDVRIDNSGYIICLPMVRFAEYGPDTLFIYFYGDNKNICRITDPLMIAKFSNAAANYISPYNNPGGGGTVEMEYSKRIDSTVNDTILYIGEALPGAAEASASWRIRKIEFINEDTVITWADGTTNLVYKWTDHLTLTYV